jgi:hypothetical protein
MSCEQYFKPDVDREKETVLRCLEKISDKRFFKAATSKYKFYIDNKLLVYRNDDDFVLERTRSLLRNFYLNFALLCLRIEAFLTFLCAADLKC